MTGPHAGFIIASYAIAFAVVAGAIVWTILDHRLTRRAMSELEARRSPRGTEDRR